MKLFKLLDANHKSAEENWQILNQLDRKITITGASASAVTITATVSFYLYAIVAVYALLGSFALKPLSVLEEYELLADLITVPSVFDLIPLPWYAVVLLMIVGVFAVPFLAALLAKGITLLICRFAAKEKTEPLPTEPIERARALAQRTERLYHRQYNSTGADLSTYPSYIGSVLFGITPLLTLVCTPATREMVLQPLAESFGLHIALGWTIVVLILLAVMIIPSVVFWFLFISLELAFDNLILRLHFPKNWNDRNVALKKEQEAFYQRWIAIDPAERHQDELRKQADAEAWEREKRRKEEYMRTMAAAYARDQREHREYLDRLHQWATDGDDPTPGCGDGI